MYSNKQNMGSCFFFYKKKKNFLSCFFYEKYLFNSLIFSNFVESKTHNTQHTTHNTQHTTHNTQHTLINFLKKSNKASLLRGDP